MDFGGELWLSLREVTDPQGAEESIARPRSPPVSQFSTGASSSQSLAEPEVTGAH